jgi:hypothetical protein
MPAFKYLLSQPKLRQFEIWYSLSTAKFETNSKKHRVQTLPEIFLMTTFITIKYSK